MAKFWMDADDYFNRKEKIEVNKEKNNYQKKLSSSKKTRIINVKTGEVMEFESAIEASKYMDHGKDFSSYLARTKKTSDDGWRAEYI